MITINSSGSIAQTRLRSGNAPQRTAVRAGQPTCRRKFIPFPTGSFTKSFDDVFFCNMRIFQQVPNSVQQNNPARQRYDREMSMVIPQEPTPRNVSQASTTLLASQPAATTFCNLDSTEDKIEDTSAHVS